MFSYDNLIRHKGNQELLKAVELATLSLQSTYPLNIHAFGLRGTGKTTILRAARTILPTITRIKNCAYNCDPANPVCPEHKNLSPSDIQAIGSEIIPMPFVEISHSAKLGTVVGSIDLQKLTSENKPTAAVLPGTLAQAHRGVVFVDEINRLADTAPELTDVLLDLMGTKPGRLQIEETGLPKIEIPVSVAVWAASNPDEDPGPLGNIRKQLSDRFDLSIKVERPLSVEKLVSIILDNHNNDQRTTSEDLRYNFILPQLINLDFPEQLLHSMAQLFLDYDIESIRALKSWHQCSRFSAIWRNSDTVSWQDLLDAAPSCLRHRVAEETLREILYELKLKTASSESSNDASEHDDNHDCDNKESEPPGSELKNSKSLMSWLFRQARSSEEDPLSVNSPNHRAASVNKSSSKLGQTHVVSTLGTEVVPSPLQAQRLRNISPGKRLRSKGEE